MIDAELSLEYLLGAHMGFKSHVKGCCTIE